MMIRSMVLACLLALPFAVQAKRAAPRPPAVPAIVQVSQIDLPNNSITLIGSQTVTVAETRTVTKVVGGQQVTEAVIVNVVKTVAVPAVYQIGEYRIVTVDGKDQGDKAWEKLALNQIVIRCDTMPEAKVLKLFAADVLLLVKK